jgi:hypothetical protein
MRVTCCAVVASFALLTIGSARTGRAAPLAPLTDGEPVSDGEPASDGEPVLVAADSNAPPIVEAARTHKGQFGLAVSLVTGGRFIKTYDNEYCGHRDSNGGTTGNSAYCLSRVPFAFDLVVSYGVTPRIELLLELRLGVERDFGGTATDTSGPRVRHYAPGVKFYFTDRGLMKFFSTAQLSIDSTGYTDPAGADLGTDVAIRNANGLQLDFHDAYGAYAYFAEEAAFKRWISIGVELGVGFQGRYP